MGNNENRHQKPTLQEKLAKRQYHSPSRAVTGLYDLIGSTVLLPKYAPHIKKTVRFKKSDCCGGVLRVTSANLSGQMPARSAAEALKDVGLEADLSIDGGISPGGVASTVVKIGPDNSMTLLREGAIAESDLRAALAEG